MGGQPYFFVEKVFLRNTLVCNMFWHYQQSGFGTVQCLQKLHKKMLRCQTCVTNTIIRVAKCHRYGRYICVKLLEGWGKKCRRPRSFVNVSSFQVNSDNFYVVLSLNQPYLIFFLWNWPSISISFNLSVKFVAIYALFMG